QRRRRIEIGDVGPVEAGHRLSMPGERPHVRSRVGRFPVCRPVTLGYRGSMASMTYPKCEAPMSEYHRAGAQVSQCDGCEGLFLDRSDLGLLIEEENVWHDEKSGYHTQPLPRITPTMT